MGEFSRTVLLVTREEEWMQKEGASEKVTSPLSYKETLRVNTRFQRNEETDVFMEKNGMVSNFKDAIEEDIKLGNDIRF